MCGPKPPLRSIQSGVLVRKNAQPEAGLPAGEVFMLHGLRSAPYTPLWSHSAGAEPSSAPVATWAARLPAAWSVNLSLYSSLSTLGYLSVRLAAGELSLTPAA